MIVFLVGYMGSGKTTIGQDLAARLQYSFIDTDVIIEKQIGTSISDYFSKEGESAFRILESKVLSELSTNTTNVVVATGGGLPCFNSNMKFINKNGLSIYLKSSLNTLVERLQMDENRPLIYNKSKSQLKRFVSHHLRDRKVYYEQAKIKVWNRGTKLAIVDRIHKKINNKII